MSLEHLMVQYVAQNVLSDSVLMPIDNCFQSQHNSNEQEHVSFKLFQRQHNYRYLLVYWFVVVTLILPTTPTPEFHIAAIPFADEKCKIVDPTPN